MTDTPTDTPTDPLSPENQVPGQVMTGLPPILRYGENNGHVAPDAPSDETPAPTERTPRADGKISCTVCGGWVKPSYMQAHMVKMHDMGRKREFKPRPYSKGKPRAAAKAVKKTAS